MNLANGFNPHSGTPESHLIFLLVTGLLTVILVGVGVFFVMYMKRSGMFVK